MTYQSRGIFYGEPHPSNAPGQKLNPLQQLTYLALLNVLFPLQIVTGALIWAVGHWPAVGGRAGRALARRAAPQPGRLAVPRLLRPARLPGHHRPHRRRDHLKSMITGYQHVEPRPEPEGADHDARPSEPRPYVNPYLAGTLLGVVLFLSFFITGGGLGASGALQPRPDRRARLVRPRPRGPGRLLRRDGRRPAQPLGPLRHLHAGRHAPGRPRLGPLEPPREARDAQGTAHLHRDPLGLRLRRRRSSWATARGWPAAAPRARRSPAARCSRSGAGPSCSPSSRRLRGGLVRPPALELRRTRHGTLRLCTRSPAPSATPSSSAPSASASAPRWRWPASATPASWPAQFYLRDMTVLKVMFTGIVVAAVLVAAAPRRLRPARHEPRLGEPDLPLARDRRRPDHGRRLRRRRLLPRHLAGRRRDAQDRRDALRARRRSSASGSSARRSASFEAFWLSSNMGRFTLPEWLGLPLGVTVLLVVAMALVALLGRRAGRAAASAGSAWAEVPTARAGRGSPGSAARWCAGGARGAGGPAASRRPEPEFGAAAGRAAAARWRSAAIFVDPAEVVALRKDIARAGRRSSTSATSATSTSSTSAARAASIAAALDEAGRAAGACSTSRRAPSPSWSATARRRRSPPGSGSRRPGRAEPLRRRGRHEPLAGALPGARLRRRAPRPPDGATAGLALPLRDRDSLPSAWPELPRSHAFRFPCAAGAGVHARARGTRRSSARPRLHEAREAQSVGGEGRLRVIRLAR